MISVNALEVVAIMLVILVHYGKGARPCNFVMPWHSPFRMKRVAVVFLVFIALTAHHPRNPWYQGHHLIDERGKPLVPSNANRTLHTPTRSGGKFLTIVTGASDNHIEMVFTNLMATLKWRIIDRINESYFDYVRVIFYDLDIDEITRKKNEERISKIPFVEYRRFNYHLYPLFFNIKQYAGEYSWKPTIIEEVIREEQHHTERDVNLVYWIDSGLVVSTNCVDFDTDVQHALEHGIYTPRGGPRISKRTHKGTADYLNISSEIWDSPKHHTISAGIFLADVKNTTVYNKIVKQWADCAYVKDCISPPGATFGNHNQDQSVLALLLAKHSIQLTTKPGERLMYNKPSTSCVVRGDEYRPKLPNPERIFTSKPERIEVENGTKVAYYCEGNEWLPGTGRICFERVLNLIGAYKMSDHAAKEFSMGFMGKSMQGCTCEKNTSLLNKSINII